MDAVRIPSTPPVIKPLADVGASPLFSVMIPTYNCSAYLAATLQSVLSQDVGALQMQIEVVDDCSTDADLEMLVQTIGCGRVNFFRHQQNVGSLRNFEACINRAHGQWVHILHGDDMVKPGYYTAIERLIDQHSEAGAAFTGLDVIDENGQMMYENNLIQKNPGVIKDWLLKIARQQLLRTCCIVVKRSVYEEVGGYYGVHYGEDWEMFVRIAAHCAVAYTPQSLAMYRIHNQNISTRYLATAQNIKDTQQVINTIQQYLPQAHRKELAYISRKNLSIHFVQNAMGIYKKQRDARLALVQAHGALCMQVNKTTLMQTLKLYVKILLRR